MKTINYQSPVYYYPSFQNLDRIKLGKQRPFVGEVPEDSDAVRIGSATVTVELDSNDSMTRNQIAVLTKALEKDRAESQLRQNRIAEKIGKLQALTLDGQKEAS